MNQAPFPFYASEQGNNNNNNFNPNQNNQNNMNNNMYPNNNLNPNNVNIYINNDPNANPYSNNNNQVPYYEKLSDTPFEFRIGFIKKVYGILITQMIITFLLTLLTFVGPIQTWINNNNWIMFVGILIMIITLIPLSCARDASRKVPLNYLLLLGFTIGTSILLMGLCGTYNIQIVLIAWGFAISMSVALTIYAFFAQVSFNQLCAIGFVVVISMLLMGILMAIIRTNYLQILYCALGAILYGLFLVCDTKLLIGDNAIKYNIDDYVFASLNLYLDIIMIFLYALSASKNS